MSESNLTKCRSCGQIKVRTEAGKYNPRNKRFVDDKQKLWSGTVCPACHVDNMKSRMRAQRVVDQQVKNLTEIKNGEEKA